MALREMQIQCAHCYTQNAFGRLVSAPKDSKDRTDRAVAFLRTHVSFGSLDVSMQRLAMVYE